jgi:DNA-binding CsgD family transcriptional regulator
MLQQSTEALLGAAVDMLELAMIALQQAGRIAFANRAAQELLQARQGLLNRNGTLAGSDHQAQQALDLLLAAGARGHCRAALLSRTRRVRLYGLIAPLARVSDNVSTSRSLSVLLVFDAVRPTVWAPSLMRDAFGLTGAEARLAHALASGKTLGQHALETKVSLSTVRSQLRHILQKTHTRRQSELSSVLARLPAVRAAPALMRPIGSGKKDPTRALAVGGYGHDAF